MMAAASATRSASVGSAPSSCTGAGVAPAPRAPGLAIADRAVEPEPQPAPYPRLDPGGGGRLPPAGSVGEPLGQQPQHVLDAGFRLGGEAGAGRLGHAVDVEREPAAGARA